MIIVVISHRQDKENVFSLEEGAKRYIWQGNYDKCIFLKKNAFPNRTFSLFMCLVDKSQFTWSIKNK